MEDVKLIVLETNEFQPQKEPCASKTFQFQQIKIPLRAMKHKISDLKTVYK